MTVRRLSAANLRIQPHSIDGIFASMAGIRLFAGFGDRALAYPGGGVKLAAGEWLGAGVSPDGQNRIVCQSRLRRCCSP
jgi:hypothetical protein